ncbi:hypothetical protein LINGRAHAP2_LOCUS24729, partial [Linum grandiflorum]
YAYLGKDSTLPVIISSSLTLEQEEKLLQVLRQHIKAIGWTIADITGISPAFCMHKILMEEGHKPTIEHQRRLNPHMKEVVQKEVMKLLDAGIIYPISDSPWDIFRYQSHQKIRKRRLLPARAEPTHIDACHLDSAMH